MNMQNFGRNILLILSFLVCMQTAQAQFGIGLTASTDIYQLLQNPKADDHGTAGSALLNVGVGPKIWVGSKDFSVSAEGQAVLGIFGLSVKDYRGLGMASVPLMVKLNFAGLSGLDKEGRMGFSIGGGLQYSKTELYYTKDSFTGDRDWFRTYIVQAGYGFGLSGFGLHGFARYGWNPDTEARNFHVGVQYDFNLPMLKKITAPESSL